MTYAHAQERIAGYDKLLTAWRSLDARDIADLGYEGDQFQQDIDDLQKHRDQLQAAWSIVGQKRPKRQRAA